MRRIHFSENNFILAVNALKEKAKILSDFVAMFKTLGLGKLPDNDIMELIHNPELYIKKRTSEKINSSSGLSILGFKIKSDKIFDFVEKGDELIQFLNFYEEKIKKWDLLKKIDTLELHGSKFSLKQEVIENLEKENSVYISPDQEELYDAFDNTVKNLNNIYALLKKKGYSEFHSPIDQLFRVCAGNNGKSYIEPTAYKNHF
jgi:hypothetical protein